MKYWVFDLDGTLVDSLTIHFQTMEKVFNHFDRSFGSDDHKEVLKLSSKSLPSYFLEKFDNNNVTAAQNLFKTSGLKWQKDSKK
jgi:beta-phosphoglucomutase-like phosphatase (HAD superfamily)